jgi:hypothetical protein
MLKEQEREKNNAFFELHTHHDLDYRKNGPSFSLMTSMK